MAAAQHLYTAGRKEEFTEGDMGGGGKGGGRGGKGEGKGGGRPCGKNTQGDPVNCTTHGMTCLFVKNRSMMTL